MLRFLRSFACLVALAVGGCDLEDPPVPPYDPCDDDPCGPTCRFDCDRCPEREGCFCAADPARTCAASDECGGAPGDVWACIDLCCELFCSAAECAASCPSPLGCACDGASCRPVPCSADAECPDRSCVEGVCAPPPAAEIASCELHPLRVVLVPGASAALRVALRAPGGAALELPAGAAPRAEGPIALDGWPGHARATGAGVVRFDGALQPCQAEIVVVEPAVGASVVTVVDEASGAPIGGALVRVDGLEYVADEDGLVRFDGQGLSGLDVSAVEHETTSLRGDLGRAVRVPLRRRAAPVAAAVQREPEVISNNVHAVLAGLGFRRSPRDLSLRTLLGPALEVAVNFGGEQLVDVGSGLAFGLGRQWYRGESLAADLDGCADASCVRAAWALGVDHLLADVPIERRLSRWDMGYRVLGPGGDRTAGMVPDVALSSSGTDADGIPFASTEVRVPVASGRALRLVVELPDAGASPIVLGGAFVGAAGELPGRGMVVRGLSTALDLEEDGTLDEPVVDRQIPLEVWPRPAGGDRGYVVFAFAASRKPARWDCGTTCVESLRVLHTEALPDGSSVSLGGAFVAAPTGSYDPSTRTLELCAEAPATAVRATLRSEGGSLTLWADRRCTTVVLPRELVEPLGTRELSVELQALELDRPLRDVVRIGGVGLDRALDATRAATKTRLQLP